MRTLVSFSLFAFSACTALGTYDASPPQVSAVHVDSHDRLSIRFDRDLVRAQATVDDDAVDTQIHDTDTVELAVGRSLELGVEHRWAIEAETAGGSRSKSSGTFYARAARPARIRLDEVRTVGSARRPEAARWTVVTPGTIAALCVEVRSSRKQQVVKIFPHIELRVGEELVLHFRRSGRVEETDETSSRAQSSALDTNPGVWDFWADDAKGLSDTNGAIVVYPAPGDAPEGAVVWSNSLEAGRALVEDCSHLWIGEPLDASTTTSVKTWLRLSRTTTEFEDSARVWKLAAKGESRIGPLPSPKPSKPEPSRPRRVKTNT